ncbi:Sodium-dependent multivitamin transporter [Araneus ventricosus]|uniref:Sodium-dependent multivitamin transporter n=1 Tax=Araneus ventricosus TaxID=182803 RepID=A0A4Y2PYR1_ARAVE|nr:Sodium-dependent multivitamin transporter [Araneus ventricosus]
MYLYGTQYIMSGLGIPVGGLLAAYGILPVFYEMQVSTAYEYLERRFGKTTRIVTATLYTFQTILYMGVVLYAPALALNAVTGLSTWASILTLAAICMIYSSQIIDCELSSDGVLRRVHPLGRNRPLCLVS